MHISWIRVYQRENGNPQGAAPRPAMRTDCNAKAPHRAGLTFNQIYSIERKSFYLATYATPHAAFKASALSVRSQVNSGSSRPKWP